MKRLFFIMFALTLLLAGCQSTEQESSPSENNPTEVVEGSTILSLKQKYGSESEQAIMPMYNVAQDEEFTFKFKADLRKNNLSAIDIIVYIPILKHSKQAMYMPFAIPMATTFPLGLLGGAF